MSDTRSRGGQFRPRHWPDLARSPARSADDVDVTGLKQIACSRPIYRIVKRAVDLGVVLLTAPAVLVIVAMCAVLIAILMGRPIFFMQDRVGLHGRVFRMIKLRTMQARPASGSRATTKQDPRITPLGQVLRRSHLDELPQLLNILLGHMTLIGPRPEQPELAALYSTVIPNYDLRHLVRPGLSGLAQVYSGYAADVSETRSKLAYDLLYIQHFGPAMDLHVVLRTILIYCDPMYVR